MRIHVNLCSNNQKKAFYNTTMLSDAATTLHKTYNDNTKSVLFTCKTILISL